ncbi:uncharacterized protein LOC132699873 [Cylas formicarius]|uniref:uncharacterized protein LOC132699873 n=1 Tax=Cylas formicarius TaxID=197179 RepID=UPI002958835A|nr:uncharacterized protein LOC132699873 [Cylas formicarius]
MDPWQSCQSRLNISDKNTLKFEDNFIDKLPDHKEYLAVLEGKLLKIKNDPNILQQLAAKKEVYMRQLLNEESERYFEYSSLDEPISSSQIVRAILTQRQALNQGEILNIIKYDELGRDDKDPAVNTPPTENRSP